MKRIFLPSLLILAVLQGFGFCLAAHKPLWNDELFTQTGVLSQSYGNIVLGKNTSEGNIAPLFYVQQKIVCDIFRFKTPQAWMDHHWDYVDPWADIFLRVLPVFWMSCFFLLLFIYFSYRFNLGLGILGLFIGLTSPFLWIYWAEARPYGLWVLLTALQMILFLEILEKRTVARKQWFWLSIVHISLSLTCILSFCQIISVSLMLVAKERRWQKYILLLAVPLAVILYYRPHAAANDVIFVISIKDMVLSVTTGVRLYVLLLYLVLLRIYFLQRKDHIGQLLSNDDIPKAFPFFFSIILTILMTVVFLVLLQRHATGQGQFVVSRHIIFLAPITIIGITYLTGLIWQGLKASFGLRTVMLLIIAGCLLWRMDNLLWHIQALYIYNIYS